MRHRDHYQTLQVPRGADADEIRRAFRRLAHRWHPDKNPNDPAAEDRFKDINEAYTVLSDPSRRAKYDLFGHDDRPWRLQVPDLGRAPILGFLLRTVGGLAGFRATSDPDARFDARVVVAITLEEAALGAERRVVHGRNDPCGPCSGTGESSGTMPRTCQSCGGTGLHFSPVRVPGIDLLCRACAGSGFRIERPCQACRGRGTRQAESSATVAVPPGSGNGDVVRVKGVGHARRIGPRGDLVAFVELRPHPVFRREGLDVSCEIELAAARAQAGGAVDVPGLFGPLTLTVPPGTRHGQTFRLRGRGLRTAAGASGNQYVRVIVRA